MLTMKKILALAVNILLFTVYSHAQGHQYIDNVRNLRKIKKEGRDLVILSNGDSLRGNIGIQNRERIEIKIPKKNSELTISGIQISAVHNHYYIKNDKKAIAFINRQKYRWRIQFDCYWGLNHDIIPFITANKNELGIDKVYMFGGQSGLGLKFFPNGRFGFGFGYTNYGASEYSSSRFNFRNEFYGYELSAIYRIATTWLNRSYINFETSFNILHGNYLFEKFGDRSNDKILYFNTYGFKLSVVYDIKIFRFMMFSPRVGLNNIIIPANNFKTDYFEFTKGITTNFYYSLGLKLHI